MPWLLFFGGNSLLTWLSRIYYGGRGWGGGESIIALYLFIFSSIFSIFLSFTLYRKLLFNIRNIKSSEFTNKIIITLIPLLFSLWAIYVSTFEIDVKKTIIVPLIIALLIPTIYITQGLVKKLISRAKNA